jgi:MoaA/NifB/PqqE/SkfB family radical SAM enzyme
MQTTANPDAAPLSGTSIAILLTTSADSEGNKVALPLIKVVQLTLTNRCQCRCIHCGVSRLREEIKGELGIEQLNLLFQDLRLSGCQVVDLFGGEPTLRIDLFEIIARAKSHGFMVSLETNGYVIDEKYMNNLVAAGLDQIYLSLDDYRAEVHDAIRRKKGCFDRAVRALDMGSKTNIIMHVSTVPPSRDFFLSGDVNRFMQFVLDHGAQKVRLLLPRFAGDSIHSESGPVYAGEERDLFCNVSDQYRDYIYVHTPGTPLSEKNVCTAKQVFCHVMSNGWVAPCPYFPLVFGDATREPIMDVFERIQSHPLVRLGGDYCPMRNAEFIDKHMRDLGLERPFFPITVTNQIDLAAPCRASCANCSYGEITEPGCAEAIFKAIDAVPKEYTRVEFHGGDAFLRDDLFSILDRIPPGKNIVLWTAGGGLPKSASFIERLRSYPVEAIKVHFPVQLMSDGVSAVREDGLEKALRTIGSIASWGLSVHLYIPGDLIRLLHGLISTNIHRLGVERLYVFVRDKKQPLTNYVGCFGRNMGRAQILWVDRRKSAAPH